MPIETKGIALQTVLKKTGTGSRLLQSVQTGLYQHEKERSFETIGSLKAAMDTWKNRELRGFNDRNVKSFLLELSTEINEEYDFLRQLHVAAVLSDILLDRRGSHIVNDADTSAQNKGALMQSMTDQLKMAFDSGSNEFDPKAFLAKNRKTGSSHWKNKGRTVSRNMTMKIRCAECAALVVHKLRKSRGFTLPLSIIEQGKGSIDGHFWVVAGNITNPTGTPNFGEDTFAIDLWGAATDHLSKGSIIGPPATRPFEMKNNSVKKLVTFL